MLQDQPEESGQIGEVLSVRANTDVRLHLLLLPSDLPALALIGSYGLATSIRSMTILKIYQKYSYRATANISYTRGSVIGKALTTDTRGPRFESNKLL